MQAAQRYQDVLTQHLVKPLEYATSMAAAFYTDPEIFAHELAVLDERHWRVAAAGGQVARHGDVLPVTLSGMPLLVTRDRDGTPGCFHNICKHRGVPLVSERASDVHSIRYPYHAWRYGLNGTLERASHFNGIHDHHVDASHRACLELDRVRSASWNGLVCVNPGGRAAPLADTLAALDRHRHDYDFSQVQYGGALHCRGHGNLKLVVENFLDSYRHQFVHPALNKASLWNEHYPVVDAHFFGVGTQVYDAATAGHGGLPTFAGLSPQRACSAEYRLPSPTLMLGLHADYLFVLAVDPVDVLTINEHVYFFFIGEPSAGAPAAHDDGDPLDVIRMRVRANWDRINREDVPTIEGMQACRCSPGHPCEPPAPACRVAAGQSGRRGRTAPDPGCTAQ
ncbi:aromatic ring-hydroxylating dioxygenase subunit alpha [Burkholderia arboris]|uniref:aromatic ring-hydroxylating oxygenase subunit alpha n=1 Tax=Burkholderia arboris TaxID=488730 RepID=UPI001CA3F02A|nr:aromatic ring-hydroxylating dioxygenase subunit alpha [Burkholderia arboris]MBY8610651.1 aromatic ring-hydroxylating dioxygenase subunit alpha [Burkholderia arboris]